MTGSRLKTDLSHLWPSVRPSEGVGHESLQSLDLVLARIEFAARKFEEGCAQLKQQNVRESVFVNLDKNRER